MIEERIIFKDNNLSNSSPDIFRGAMSADIEEIKRALELCPDALNLRHEAGGLTPLAVAAWYGNYSVVDFLCKQPGIDYLALDDFGRTVWHGAVALGREDIVDRIMQDAENKLAGKLHDEDRQNGAKGQQGNITEFRPKIF